MYMFIVLGNKVILLKLGNLQLDLMEAFFSTEVPPFQMTLACVQLT